ncbi:MAG: hypothetical protein EPO22_05370 [Dehalococcoidia bacterium]|nr:MAG: hypothetical protein EPO22_05370 [Dehalococcoidia bacterium]
MGGGTVHGLRSHARWYARLAIVAVLATAALTPTRPASTSGDGPSGQLALSPPGVPLRPPSGIVVRAKSPADLDRVAAYARANGFWVNERAPSLSALRLAAPDGVSVDAAIAQLDAVDGVAYAEPAYTMMRADVPADPLYTREAAYLDIERAPDAWGIETGNASTLVAVLDTGIDLTHPDLQGRIWTNAREIAGNGVDDDGNGCIDDVRGCAFVSDPSPGCTAAHDGAIDDDLGHGTFVTGIIAANANTAGMVGVARGVTILPVKVLDCDGAGDSLAVAQGVLYAAKEGARIVNISLGGPADSAILREAVRIAHDDYGVLVVAASGNTGAVGVAYPARYPNVLAVGAAAGDNPDKRAAFSTTGPEIDVVAIGQDIVGTVPKSSCGVFLPCLAAGPYAVGDGTSFAAPQVTGLVALVLSHTPTLSAASLLGIVKATAHAVPAGDRSDWAGAGRIDMLQALERQFRLGAPGVTRN